MKRSEQLFARAQEIIPGGVNSPVRAFRSVGGTPFFTASAQGCRLRTVDGAFLIDYVGTYGPAIHGHNAEPVRRAVAGALESGTSFGTPNELEVELAERVVERVPSVEQVRFCNSGTEACMSALRLARGATGRDQVVKFTGCYHGHVDSLLVKAGSGALTHGNPDSAGVPRVFAETTRLLRYNDEAAAEALFAESGESIAAVMVEPYPANCGLILPEAGFLEKLRELCTRHGALLIFDEVMTGFRVAPGGVQALSGVIPDLTAMGKIIGGGLPVGAFGGRREIMEQLAPVGPVYQAGTLSGNPLAMAAGVASLDLLAETDPYSKLDESSGRLQEGLLAAAREKGIALQVPRAGSMFALFFAAEPVTDFDAVLAADSEPFRSVFQYALANGVFLPPSPYETCFLSTAHGREEIDRTVEVLGDAIRCL